VLDSIEGVAELVQLLRLVAILLIFVAITKVGMVIANWIGESPGIASLVRSVLKRLGQRAH